MKRKILLGLGLAVLLAGSQVMASCMCQAGTKTATSTTSQGGTATLSTTTTTTTTTATTPIPSGLSPQMQSATLDIAIVNGRFSLQQITVSAGAMITLTLHNEESGTIHNLSIYRNANAGAADAVFVGQAVSGSYTITYRFQAPAKGVYYFRCDYFPATLQGTFVAL